MNGYTCQHGCLWKYFLWEFSGICEGLPLVFTMTSPFFPSNSFGSIPSFYQSFIELDSIYSYAWVSFNGRSKQEVEI